MAFGVLPAVFVNGIKIGGAVPIEKFREAIDSELKAANIKVKPKTVMP